MPNGNFSEHFFRIFLKLERREVIILCKLYVANLYLCITLIRVSLISILTFRLSLTLFVVSEKFLGRKINLHFLRVPAKNCRKQKLV